MPDLKQGVRPSDDRGAVTTLVAVLLAFGVLLGISAFVVDLGRAHLEHRTVQNAADQAARAVAQQCAERSTGCASNGTAVTAATSISGANSFDGSTSVTSVCGAGTLGACSSSVPAASMCRSVPAARVNTYARVTTTTRTGSGASSITPIFMFGGSGMQSDACAQAIWGPAAGVPVQFPFIIPICSYNSIGSPIIHDFVPNDPLETCTIATLNGTLTFNQVVKGFSYVRLPAGSASCSVPVQLAVGDVLEREPSTAQLCGNQIEAKLTSWLGKPMWLPVATSLYCTGSANACKTGQGSYQFKVASFVRYTMTGFKLQSREGGTPPAGGWKAASCTSSGACLVGTFTRGVNPDSTVSNDPSTPSLGVFAVTQIP